MSSKEGVKTYKGIEYESQEELMLLYWLEELQENGYVEKITRAESMVLCEPAERRWAEEKQMKTKIKVVEKRTNVLQGHIYTPEYKVEWNDSARPMIIDYLLSPKKSNSILKYTAKGGQLITYLEVKPEYDQNNMTRLFTINQKWVYKEYGIYINLVKPYNLYEKTFTPAIWMKTSSGKDRKINWEVRTLDQWLESIKTNTDEK